MAEYSISEVWPEDKGAMRQIDALLEREGIRRDKNLDYTCAMYDENYQIIATGSCFGCTLRCFAVSSDHQGEGLLNSVVSHLIDYQFSRGNYRLFLYTKSASARFFASLGFYPIAEVPGTLVFMENSRSGFAEYLTRLKKETTKAGEQLEQGPGERAGALVMNANPFTLGHQYLVEHAAAKCSVLHLFMVSEDASLVPFAVRARLIREGTAHLKNIVYHESGPYIISNATFPSYFLRDEEHVITTHAQLDLAVFSKIAEALGINCRYVGEEPTSLVTGIYNQIMAAQLPQAGISCEIVPRKEIDGQPISASTVRTLLKEGNLAAFERLVPKSTADYFESPAAEPVLSRIRAAKETVHY